jgi:hypothetical protein
MMSSGQSAIATSHEDRPVHQACIPAEANHHMCGEHRVTMRKFIVTYVQFRETAVLTGLLARAAWHLLARSGSSGSVWLGGSGPDCRLPESSEACPYMLCVANKMAGTGLYQSEPAYDVVSNREYRYSAVIGRVRSSAMVIAQLTPSKCIKIDRNPDNRKKTKKTLVRW